MGMTEDEWLAGVIERSRVPLVHPADPVAAGRSLLFDLYTHALEAPADVLMRFAAVPDAMIAPLADEATERFHRGDFGLRAPANIDAPDALVLLGYFIAGLDAFLSQARTGYGAVSDPQAAWAVSAGGREGFLIPRDLPRAPGSGKGRSDLGTFIHRVMRRHRVLPAQVGAYAVRLFQSEMELGRDIGDPVVGGGLFPDLDLDTGVHQTDTEFRVGAVICEDQSRLIDEHLVRAHVDGCAVMAFPELTITPQERARIAAQLKERPWGEVSSATIALLLAGSWHEQDDGRWFNLATVFDGYGRPLAQHRKLFPFMDKAGRLEAVASGRAISVVVTDDALVAFGICRDFCERGGPSPNPYSLLDVDLFVIASYGDERTMEGHFATAHDVRIRFRAATFVVQQAPPSEVSPVLGYVLSPDAGGAVDLGAVQRDVAWNSSKMPASTIDSDEQM